jgi:hypothetical protein
MDNTEILYAITDPHGRLDLLSKAYDAIVVNALGRAARIIFLGDAIDRGPDSKGCIDRLIRGAEGMTNFAPQINLLGNHEDMMIQTLNGRLGMIDTWLFNGGIATLKSYGKSPPYDDDLSLMSIVNGWTVFNIFTRPIRTSLFTPVFHLERRWLRLWRRPQGLLSGYASRS